MPQTAAHFAVTVFFVFSLAAAPRPMTLVDVISVPQILEPQLSPDGRQIVFVKSVADWKANRRIGHIWRINSDGSGSVQMTSGTDGESSPRWSPDGKWIAFIAKRGTEADAVNQIFLISAASGEARALTTHATQVFNIAWSPDGTGVYFRAADAKTDEQKARDKLKDDVFLFDEDFQQQHLWRVSVTSKTERRITHGAYSVLSFNVSEDGKMIVCHRAPSPLLEDSDQSEVWIMDSGGGNPRRITDNWVPESEATLSPDNSQVLFLSQANQKFETYYNRKIFVAPVAGGAARVLNADLPYEVDRASWSKDGKAIYFLANMGVHSELFKVPARGGDPEQLTSGKHALTGWSMPASSNAHVYTVHEMSSPGEIWVSGLDGNSAPHKVTSVYDNLTREFQLPRQERVEWKGADGVAIEGLLYYPLDYQEGKRYPLVVQTHGGPQASDKFGFGGLQNYVPVLTAKGYAVLQPNYRGSTGYGDAFLRDMVGHYFLNAHLDVLAGVDYLIQRGIADPDRLVKMGWSGGGHMTNKLITTTGRFKAASAGAGAATGSPCTRKATFALTARPGSAELPGRRTRPSQSIGTTRP